MTLDGFSVIRLNHDARHPLGPRVAHYGTPARTELAAAVSHGTLDLRYRFERRLLPDGNVTNHLRKGLEATHQFIERLPGLRQQLQHFEQCDDSVAGERNVGEDDVAGGLAAEVDSRAQHLLEHVFVTHWRPLEADALPRQRQLETQVGHQRPNHRVSLERAVTLQKRGHRIEDMIAVGNPAFARREDGAIAVAVESDTEVRAPRLGLMRHPLGMERPAIQVDVAAVRLGVEDAYVDAQLLGERRDDIGRRTVRAIYDDAESRRAHVFRQQPRQVLDIVAAQLRVGGQRSLHRGDALEPAARVVELALDFELDGLVDLGARAREDLDAVVLIRIVGRRNHDAGNETATAREIGDARRCDHASVYHVHPTRPQSRSQ